MLTAVVAMARKNRKPSATRKLHRWAGAAAALFILFMAASGLLINHSDGLSLDQKQAMHPALLDWYGLARPADIQSYPAAGHWLSFAGSQLYLDGVFVTTCADGVGAVFNGQIFIAAGRNEILLIDDQGRLIEKQAWIQPAGHPIESIGLVRNDIVAVKSADTFWAADAELLAWRPLDDPNTAPLWSVEGSAPETVQQAITRHYRGDGLNMERVLLDLHSGRIFGQAGVLVYDLLALLVVFLAISGLVLWVRVLRNRNGKSFRP
jgi:hypothetical protein